MGSKVDEMKMDDFIKIEKIGEGKVTWCMYTCAYMFLQKLHDSS